MREHHRNRQQHQNHIHKRLRDAQMFDLVQPSCAVALWPGEQLVYAAGGEKLNIFAAVIKSDFIGCNIPFVIVDLLFI